jgi:hypothetical protein
VEVNGDTHYGPHAYRSPHAAFYTSSAIFNSSADGPENSIWMMTLPG